MSDYVLYEDAPDHILYEDSGTDALIYEDASGQVPFDWAGQTIVSGSGVDVMIPSGSTPSYGG
jgi:hypothetical protein